MFSVKAFEQAEFEVLHAFGGGSPNQIGDGLGSRSDASAGVDTGKEVGTKNLGSRVRQFRGETDKGGQVLVFTLTVV